MDAKFGNLFFLQFGLKIMLLAVATTTLAQQPVQPVRVGIAGLTHTHVHWLLGRETRGDIEIVGIAESNADLAHRYAQQHSFSTDLVFPSLETMLNESRPEAVMAFGTTFDHLAVVQQCAPRGIHVMVEKPLAVSIEHGREMARLAREHDILLLINYETTWYGSNHRARELIAENSLGTLRKIVVHSGHAGPEKIGVNREFLDWLTDPKLNGGGAVTDFGCYGANLMTWLMDNEKPTTVTAVLENFQPEIYPDVDDEATIVLSYPNCQGIIQASWNWPRSRKDMEVYGETGSIVCEDNLKMRIRLKEDGEEKTFQANALARPFRNPFEYFAAAIRGDVAVKPGDLSALENNLIVLEILAAAKESAALGKTITLK